MRRGRAAVLAAMVVALQAGCASEAPLGGTSHVGKVQGLYVEAYRGVFVDPALAGDTQGKQMWAYLSFDQPLEDGRTVATAALHEGDRGIEPGDLVYVRFAHVGALEADALLEPNRVIALVAKHGSEAAAAYGKTGAGRGRAQLTEAQAR